MKRGKPYACLYADWYTHPKTLGLSMSARGLWATMLSFVAHHATDGRVTNAALPTLWPEATPKERERAVKELIEHQYLERDGATLQLVGYQDNNITSDEWAAKRAASAERNKRFHDRKRTSNASDENQPTDGERVTRTSSNALDDRHQTRLESVSKRDVNASQDRNQTVVQRVSNFAREGEGEGERNGEGEECELSARASSSSVGSLNDADAALRRELGEASRAYGRYAPLTDTSGAFADAARFVLRQAEIEGASVAVVARKLAHGFASQSKTSRTGKAGWSIRWLGQNPAEYYDTSAAVELECDRSAMAAGVPS